MPYTVQAAAAASPVAEKRTLDEKYNELAALQERLLKSKAKHEVVEEEAPVTKTAAVTSKDELVDSLKQTISQQQKLLIGFLKQIEELEDNGKEVLEIEVEELQHKVSKLEHALEKKDAEIESLEQQVTMAHSMTSRIDDVVKEFEHVQSRMMELEVQASKAEALELELQEANEGYDMVRHDLVRKQEKLEQTLNETQALRQQLAETEDKLAESNRQRLQLQKKVQFLQDLNEDMYSMSESNNKMKNELRRIGELESMLSMIAEERDQLLRKK